MGTFTLVIVDLVEVETRTDKDERRFLNIPQQRATLSDFDTQIRIHIRPGRAGYRRTDRGAREMRRSIVCNALRNDIAPDSPR